MQQQRQGCMRSYGVDLLDLRPTSCLACCTQLTCTFLKSGAAFCFKSPGFLPCLQALHNNHSPHSDAGIEVLYRFAGFDPFQRTSYFGVTLDLGQYERFRRIMYTPYFVSLLNLSDWELISSLEVSSVEDIVGPIAFPHPQQCLPPTFASVLLTGDLLVDPQVSETQWVARVHVVNAYRKEARNYLFWMEQRIGSKYDG